MYIYIICNYVYNYIHRHIYNLSYLICNLFADHETWSLEDLIIQSSFAVP